MAKNPTYALAATTVLAGILAAEPAFAHHFSGFDADTNEIFTYFDIGYVEGPSITVNGFAFEFPTGTLRNPLESFEVDTNGMRAAAGIDLGPLFGDAFGGLGRSVLHSLVLEAEIIDVEGRASFTGNERVRLANFGVPGVGENPGFFVGWPTDYKSRAEIGVTQWGTKLEAVFNPFATFGKGLPGDPDALAFSFVAGLHYSYTDTEIGHSAKFRTPIFPNPRTMVQYYSTIEEHAFTPYAGIVVNGAVNLDPTRVTYDFGGRIGPSFVNADLRDSLFATGLANVKQHIAVETDETLTYGSLSGSIGVENGPVRLALTGNADYGKFRDTELFRRDTVQVSPGNFQAVPTEIRLQEEWTYGFGVKISTRF
ncbi:hypothetical protein VQ045_12170 [Aurantimonas sp. E1-2-R+4]|uniref:hypothetical protein n=1 Tax=Aurantimonas sp. E1-2-R+4 TaxID=3113714 RepID=UPI002F927170